MVETIQNMSATLVGNKFELCLALVVTTEKYPRVVHSLLYSRVLTFSSTQYISDQGTGVGGKHPRVSAGVTQIDGDGGITPVAYIVNGQGS